MTENTNDDDDDDDIQDSEEDQMDPDEYLDFLKIIAQVTTILPLPQCRKQSCQTHQHTIW